MNDKAIRVKDGIYRFGTNVEENESTNENGKVIPGIGLFEGLWPIPNGASINAYVVMDEKSKKNALIDLVCEWDGQRIEIEDGFKDSGFAMKDIDYIILNHMEPDHSGWLPFVFEQNPAIKIVTNARAIELVQNFFHIGQTPEEREHIFIEVKDGDMIDLKDGSIISAGGAPQDDHGRLLAFVFIPNVHWPETMATYDAQEKVLFPCDAFGSYGRITKGRFFADELPATCDCEKCDASKKSFHFDLNEMTKDPCCVECYKREALRYYANIVASFSAPVLQAIAKASKVLDLPNNVKNSPKIVASFSAPVLQAIAKASKVLDLPNNVKNSPKIVASFSAPVLQAIAKASKVLDLPNNVKNSPKEGEQPQFSTLEVIAPSHGLMWRNNDKGYGNPIDIIDYYQEMAGYTKGPALEKVCVVWGSMYGNTERVLPFILKGIESEGVAYEVFHLPYDHIGYAMSSAFESQGLVLGMPTYEYAMYPPMVYFLDSLKRKHIKGKDTLRFGSFGWSGGAQKELTSLTTNQKRNASTGEMDTIQNFNFIDPVEWRGRATAEVEEKAFEQGAKLARQVKETIAKSKQA